MKPIVLAGALGMLLGAPAFAQSVSGTAFDDRNGNGVRDAGEPALPGVSVELYGTRDVGGAYDQIVSAAGDGTFSLAPGEGCYLLNATDPAGWRRFARALTTTGRRLRRAHTAPRQPRTQGVDD